MLVPFRKFIVVALALVSASMSLGAEQPVPSQVPGTIPPGSQYPQHPQPLGKSSGYIFAGTVRTIERIPPKGNGVATVQIDFHVDQGMQGVRAGQTLTIHEWAGLWESGESYRPGERVLLFLYPPSKLGLTSPVQGPRGRFRIGSDGRIPLNRRKIDFASPRSSEGAPVRRQIRVTPAELVRFLRSAGK